MMIEEFISRTGVTPSAAEYAEIEKEYMAADIDKDKFCKLWKKNGGIQTLLQNREKRIQELEAKLQKAENDARTMEERYIDQIHVKNDKIKELEWVVQQNQDENETLLKMLELTKQAHAETDKKLNTLKAAYAILKDL